MPRILLLLAIAGVVYILFLRARGMPPHKRRGEYIKLGIGAGVVLVIILTLSGRMHWVGAAFTALLVGARQLLPLLIRYFPMLASLRGNTASGSGQNSTVESAILRMQLDHDSGALSGEVLRGNYQGWRLQDMERAQLEELLAYCASEDNDSEQLLESYLRQRFKGETEFNRQQEAPSSAPGGLSRSEALAVLGLQEQASEEDIIAAHRSLIQKLHPDRGGNDYLAAKINQAKDFLLR